MCARSAWARILNLGHTVITPPAPAATPLQLTPTERLRGAWAATAEQRYMLAVLSPSDVATRAWIVARTVSVHLAVTLQATCRVPIPRVAPPAPAELFSVPWDTETSGFALDLGVPTPAIMFLYSPKDLTAWAKLVHWDEWTQAWVAEAAGPLTLETWAVMSDEQRVAVMKANGKTLRVRCHGTRMARRPSHLVRYGPVRRT